MVRKSLLLVTLILIILFTVSAFAQKRRSTTKPHQRPNSVAEKTDPPPVPKYEPARGNEPNRVSLPWSFVGNPKSAKSIKMHVRYIYDDRWHEIGHLNDVAMIIGMEVVSRVCADVCRFTIIIDGESIQFNGEDKYRVLDNNSKSEVLSIWLAPERFKKMAESKEISFKINDVSFNLTTKQMKGLKEMTPFLKIRYKP